MTEFERQLIFYLKCLNRRFAEIRNELHELNGYEGYYDEEEQEVEDESE